MTRMGSRLRHSMTLAAVTAVGLGVAAPAQASDASLRTAVKTQEAKLVRAAEAFEAGTQDTTSAIGRERSATALGDLQRVVRTATTATTKQAATTPRVKRRRTAYLLTLKDYTTGLGTFGQGLLAFDPDSPARAAALITKARAQLTSATTRRTTARRAILGLAK